MSRATLISFPVLVFLCILQTSNFVVYLAVCLLLLRFISRLSCGVCNCDADMRGKTVLITGASAGIGRATAQELARRNARVIMACRDMEKAKRVAQEIKLATGNGNIEVKHLDLESFDCVKRCVLDVYRTEEKLDVLINNAGIGDDKVILTKDGYERVMQVNHLSHVLLTLLLIDLLKKGSPSRIINVSSITYPVGMLDVKDMLGRKETAIRRCISNLYTRSKLANVLFTRQLASKLAETGITVNVLHPGLVRTNIYVGRYQLFAILLRLFSYIVGKSPKEGAQTSVHLAVHPEVAKVSGKFFLDCRELALLGKATDTQLAKELWEVTEEAIRAHLETPLENPATFRDERRL